MTERLLTPFANNPAFPLLRAHLLISETDMRNYDALPRGRNNHTAQVFDNVSQQFYLIRRANCGAGCYCAAEIVTQSTKPFAKPDDEQITLDVDINGTSRRYAIYMTSAPASYDGMGTFTLETGSDRLVAVDPEQIDWQLSRYGSGLHKAERVNDDRVRDALAMTLWSRLKGDA